MDRQPLHIFKSWPCGGGMEAIGRIHQAAGQRVVGVRQLAAATPWSTRNRVRGALAAAAGDPQVGVRLFYNGYGLDWALPTVPHQRSVLYLHTDFPHLDRWLRPLLPHADACLSVNPALTAKIAAAFPGFAAERLFSVALPGAPSPTASALAPGAPLPAPGEPWVIGYCGRIQLPQKRLDRIGGLLAALDQRRIPWRFEFLGDGPARSALERQFAADRRVCFHGQHTGAVYHAIMARWHFIVFASDYEGLPLALLEGLAAGALPVYPDFYAGTDWLARGGAGRCLYPVGDMGAAAALVAQVAAGDPAFSHERIRQLRVQLLAPHAADRYLPAVDHCLNAIAKLPPASPRQPGTSGPGGWLPLWCYHRRQRRLQGV
jgi:glycosyltransferase involved in cell wall biosynthesis